MDNTPNQDAEAALDDAMGDFTVRYLKRLVTALTVTTIVGLVVLVGVVVMRFSQTSPSIPLPDEITLPDGVAAQAFTQGDTWYAVVTDQDDILIFSRVTGALTQSVKINTD